MHQERQLGRALGCFAIRRCNAQSAHFQTAKCIPIALTRLWPASARVVKPHLAFLSLLLLSHKRPVVDDPPAAHCAFRSRLPPRCCCISGHQSASWVHDSCADPLSLVLTHPLRLTISRNRPDSDRTFQQDCCCPWAPGCTITAIASWTASYPPCQQLSLLPRLHRYRSSTAA
jgi:hypothetical protein